MTYGQLADHELSRRYGDILAHVTGEPQSVTDIYYRWAGLPPGRPLRRRQRNERRWLALSLKIMSRQGLIYRGEQHIEGRARIFFRTVDPDASGDT